MYLTFCNNIGIYLLLYEDDIIFDGNDEFKIKIEKLKFCKKFEMKQFDLKIDRDDDYLFK